MKTDGMFITAAHGRRAAAWALIAAVCLFFAAVSFAGEVPPPAVPPAPDKPRADPKSEFPFDVGTPRAPEAGSAGKGVTVIAGPSGDRVVRPGTVSGQTAPPPDAGVPADIGGHGDTDRLQALIQQLVAEKIAKAREAFAARNYQLVIDLCDDVLKLRPGDPQSIYLRAKAQQVLAEHEAALKKFDRVSLDKKLLDDVTNLRPPLPGEPLARPKPDDAYAFESEGMKAMRRKLQQTVSFNFLDIPLDYLVHNLVTIAGVNIIADQNTLGGKTLTLRVKDLPISDVLDFISRQYTDIHFQITDNAIWITGTQSPMLVPRIYRLRYGMVLSSAAQPSAVGRGQIGGGNANQGGGAISMPRMFGNNPAPAPAPAPPGGQGGKQQGKGGTYIEEILNNWVVTWSDWPTDGQILLDRQTNSLFVMTTVEMHKRLGQLLEVIDKPPVQVLIRSAFIEIKSDNSKGWGTNFNNIISQSGSVRLGATSAGSATGTGTTGTGTTGTGTGTTGTTGASSGINTGSTLITPNPIGTMALGGVGTDPKFNLVLTAFQQDLNSRLMSAPQIIAINNQEAFLQIGDIFQYPTTLDPIQVSSLDANGVSQTTTTSYVPGGWQEQDVGVSLQVTPSVGSDYKTIILDLHPLVKLVEGGTSQFAQYDVIGAAAAGGTQALSLRKPVFNTEEIITRVVVEDGGMFAIGGLMRNDEVETVTRVPFLGDIPLIGLLFQSKSKSTVRSNLIVLVQAEIVHPSGRRYTDTPSPMREGVGVDEKPKTGATVIPTEEGWATIE
jgi:type II secretory pathway component GspD/PulD (secretin)